MRPGYTGKRLEMVYRRRIYAARSYPCGYVSKDGTYRDLCVATTKNYVEILYFRHFFKHIVFTSEGNKIRNKEIKNYINVSVVVDIECGNTNK